MPNFDLFDMSDRPPRPIQIEALKAINDNWSNDVIALTAPCGVGKSALARAIQVATNADVITPSNILVSQYQSDYPHVNFLKGKAHYPCVQAPSQLSCRDWQEVTDPCPNCKYNECKEKAIDGYSTFFNPLSYYYHLLTTRNKGNKVLVIDEAHMLPNMVLLLTSKRFRQSDYRFDDRCVNEIYLSKWLQDQIGRLSRLSDLYFKHHEYEKLAKAKSELETLTLTKQGLDEDPQNYVIWVSQESRDTYLNIRPLFPPRFLMERLIGGKKLILMSGTLFPHDITAIIGNRPYKSIELNSPIPKSARQVYYKPAGFSLNYQTDPKQLVRYVESLLKPGVNTIVHTTYTRSKAMAPLFRCPIIFNSDDDKDLKIAEFKQNGGVFLASGCAEGLDLKGDLCRLNISAGMLWPNLSDPAVVKRKSLPDGDRWYGLTTLANEIQRAGRSTRSVDDYSDTIVIDPNFSRLFSRYKHDLPKYFVESVVFT